MGSTIILNEEAFRAKFWSQVVVGAKFECWTWQGTRRTKAGYGQIGHNHRYHLAHVLAYSLLVGEVPKGMCVLHSCDNPPCCNPKHLFLGTRGDNNTDRSNKARDGDHKGEKNGRAKLTEADVKAIRAEAKIQTYEFLAHRYKVSRVLIAKIVRRKLWKHVA